MIPIPYTIYHIVLSEKLKKKADLVLLQIFKIVSQDHIKINSLTSKAFSGFDFFVLNLRVVLVLLSAFLLSALICIYRTCAANVITRNSGYTKDLQDLKICSPIATSKTNLLID